MSARPGRTERGALFPSPVVILSIVAVTMAAIAFVATRGAEPTEREVTPSAAQPTSTAPTPHLPKTKPHRIERKQPVVQRGKVYVEVYNNSGIAGLAARVSARAAEAGWQVVGADNWYGTIPASTVYYPPRLKAAARQLALDLGIKRTALAVDPMRLDRLTVILTGPLG